jgi:predicted ATPase
MPILALQFTNAGPFDDMTFEFDEHVNVFVGPNNCGKSTALAVLGAVVVYPFAIPKKLFRHADVKFITHFTRNNAEGKPFQGYFAIKADSSSSEAMERWGEFLKEIGYTSFIPALRQSTDFRSQGPTVKTKTASTSTSTWITTSSVVTIPTLRSMSPSFSSSLEESEKLPEEFAKRRALFQTSSSLIRDEAVIESIIELDYRAYRQNDPAIRSIINKVAAIASEITEGFPIEFLRIAEDDEGLFPQFRTPDGDVPLNVLSQGTQSILQWLAYLLIGYAKYYDYPPNLEEKPGMLIIDEIDAHLHPSWQRRIIPTLRLHFPNLQLFCSTHSPLMLAGLHAGQVQLLKRDNGGKITVSRNETDIVGWSADEILRNFLNVPNPTDLETDCHVRRLQELRRIDKLSPEEAAEFEHLRQIVSQELLGGPIVTQMEQLSALFERAKAGPASKPKTVSASKAPKTKKVAKSASTSRRTTK